MKYFRNCFGLVIAALFMAGAVQAADLAPTAKFQPQLAPHFSAGEMFGYTAKVEFTSTYRIIAARKDTPAGKAPVIVQKPVEDIREDFSARLVADSALAREVFKNGSLREVVFLVKSCQLYNSDGRIAILVPAGSILAARKQDDGQVALAINGHTPDADLAERLSLLIPMGDPRDSNNELFGPKSPVGVDDTWPINEKAMLNSDLAQLFPGVKSVAGGMKLYEVKNDAQGRPRATVSGRYSLGGVTPPLPKEVEGVAEVNFNVSVTAPVTPGPGLYDMDVKSLVRHHGQNGDVMHGLSETDVDFGISFDQDARYQIDSAVAALPALAGSPSVPTLPKREIAPGKSSARWTQPPMAKTPAGTSTSPSAPTSAARPLLMPSANPAGSSSATPAVNPPSRPGSPQTSNPATDSFFDGAQDLPSQPKTPATTP